MLGRRQCRHNNGEKESELAEQNKSQAERGTDRARIKADAQKQRLCLGLQNPREGEKESSFTVRVCKSMAGRWGQFIFVWRLSPQNLSCRLALAGQDGGMGDFISVPFVYALHCAACCGIPVSLQDRHDPLDGARRFHRIRQFSRCGAGAWDSRFLGPEQRAMLTGVVAETGSMFAQRGRSLWGEKRNGRR